MRMLDEQDYAAMTAAKGAHFLAGLRDLKKRYKVIGDVDGLGMALRVEVCEADGFTPNRALVDRMCEVAMSGTLSANGKRYGLVLDIGGYYKNVITLAPALTITTEEMNLALTLLDQLFERCTRA